MKKRSPIETCWAVINPNDGRMASWEICGRRAQVIAQVAWNLQDRSCPIPHEPRYVTKLTDVQRRMWKRLQRKGYRCIRVNVVAA